MNKIKATIGLIVIIITFVLLYFLYLYAFEKPIPFTKGCKEIYWETNSCPEETCVYYEAKPVWIGSGGLHNDYEGGCYELGTPPPEGYNNSKP